MRVFVWDPMDDGVRLEEMTIVTNDIELLKRYLDAEAAMYAMDVGLEKHGHVVVIEVREDNETQEIRIDKSKGAYPLVVEAHEVNPASIIDDEIMKTWLETNNELDSERR